MSTVLGMTDSPFMTAEEKLMVLVQWETFLKKMSSENLVANAGSDYGYFASTLDKAFTKRLYSHLSMSFGFIAHYNRLGFLSARFGSAESIEETFESIIQGRGWGDKADLDNAMREKLRFYRQRILANALRRPL